MSRFDYAAAAAEPRSRALQGAAEPEKQIIVSRARS